MLLPRLRGGNQPRKGAPAGLGHLIWRAASLKNSSNKRFRSETLRSIGAAVPRISHLPCLGMFPTPSMLVRSAPMTTRGIALLALGLTLTIGLPGAAQKWSHPRTAWGDPDLEGVWTSGNNFSIPLERPADVAGKEFLDGQDLENALRAHARTIAAVADGGVVGAGASHWYENLQARSRRSSLIIDPPNGRLPALTTEARRRNAAEAGARRGRGPSDSWIDRSLWDRCITVGLPSVMFPTGYNNNVQILQAPGYVTVTHETMHDTRVVPLDGRPHVSPAIRHYMGDSRGRWEGTTLVIDVTNFHPDANYRGSRQTLHLVERYTLLANR